MIRNDSPLNPLVPSVTLEVEYEEKEVTELKFVFERGWSEAYVLDAPFTLKSDTKGYLIETEGRKIRVFARHLVMFEQRTATVMVPMFPQETK